MRPFIATGDTGRFNAGMDLSPWILFILGTVFLLFALGMIGRKIAPKIDSFADGSRQAYWAIVLAAAFILFLWGSGIRMMSLHPDPQWKVGLIGVVAFFIWLAANKIPASSSPRLGTASFGIFSIITQSPGS